MDLMKRVVFLHPVRATSRIHEGKSHLNCSLDKDRFTEEKLNYNQLRQSARSYIGLDCEKLVRLCDELQLQLRY